MYIIIIGILFGFAVGIFFESADGTPLKRMFKGQAYRSWLLGLIAGGICGLIISAIGSGVNHLDYIYEKEYTYELHAMSDGNSTSASFFIGCGSFKNRMEYHFYYQKDDGSFHYGKIYAQEASIFEEENIKIPRIIKYRKYCKMSMWWIYNGRHADLYYIYIPKGSIENKYSMDLK